MVLLILILVASFVFCSVYWPRRPEKFPPGPFSWPILGNFLNVGLESHKAVMTMKKKYGNIIGIDLGPKRSVFIHHHELIKEAFNLIPLSGRPFLPHYTINGNIRGIVFTTGKTWTDQRRFAFSYIQSGFRNGVPIEALISNETKELTEHLKDFCGKPISTSNVFYIPILNILWGIVAGQRYSLTDPNMLKLAYHTTEFMSSPAIQGVLIFYYKWAKMFPTISGYKHFFENFNPVVDYIKNIVDQHKLTYQEGIQRDLIDHYLAKIGTTTDVQSSFFGNTGEENLIFSILDIFIAGADTSFTTLRWLVFLMAHHPEIQGKLADTISKHMQERKQPSLKDRQMLPFVEAVIMEVMRFSAIVPIGIFHESTEDVEFHGYLIPKGTMIVSNQYSTMHDPEVWGDPENFRPERFLNEDETEVIRHPAFIPFSTGRRICPGDFLARDELFLFAMSLFHSYKVKFDPNVPVPPIKSLLGSIVPPIDHRVIFSEQNIKANN